jgi:nickel/cobalt transporter (NicO) family protein
MRVLISLALLVCLLLLPTAGASWAQQEQPATKIDPGKLLVQPRGGASVSFLDNPVQWVSAKQREFYGSMSKSLRQLKSQSASKAAWSLLLVSFFYGIFHAAGPGHGKAVVSTWIVANKSDLRRGLFIAFMSALFQALSAIMIVSTLMMFFSNAAGLARKSAGLLDGASFAMIAAVGVYLMWQAWANKGHHHDHQHDHGHDHDHGHQHTHDHGHTHTVTPDELRGDVSVLHMLSLALAIGIRPCTGAILVLLLSWTVGLYWAGIASTLAMGVGVFLTIAAIATLAVTAKAWALRLSSADNAKMEKLARALKFMGGLVIAGMGALLFLGSLGNTQGFV